MPEYDFVPGYPKIGDTVGGSPYNPDGTEFSLNWLNPILKGTAMHWSSLGANYTATVADYAKVIKLAGFTLTLDPIAALFNGWRATVIGPGIIVPDTGEGETVTIASTQFATISHDGTNIQVLVSSAGSQEPLATAVQLAGGIEEGTYPAALRYHAVSSFTHLHGEVISGTGSVIVYVHVNGLPVAGPFEVESGTPLDETIDVGLEIADYVDWIIEDPTGLVEYLYLQMDGSS